MYVKASSHQDLEMPDTIEKKNQTSKKIKLYKTRVGNNCCI